MLGLVVNAGVLCAAQKWDSGFRFGLVCVVSRLWSFLFVPRGRELDSEHSEFNDTNGGATGSQAMKYPKELQIVEEGPGLCLCLLLSYRL